MLLQDHQAIQESLFIKIISLFSLISELMTASTFVNKVPIIIKEKAYVKQQYQYLIH